MSFFAKWLAILLAIDDTPQGMRRWRLLVGTSIAVFGLFILWALGLGSHLGLSSGFAHASDLTDIKNGIQKAADVADEVKLRLLKKSIVDTRILQCNADSKRYYTQRLEELTDEYYADTKSVFVVPDCGDLK